MNRRNRIVNVALGLLLTSAWAVSGRAADKAVVITPTSLRARILADSLPVLKALNSIHQAKERVNLARANLLPSLNLSPLVNPSGNFALSTVEALLPFLVPANWFHLSAAKNTLYAEGQAFYLMELNTYASAYSLALAVQADQDTLEIYESQARDFQEIAQFVEDRIGIGDATQIDLDRASAQAKLSQIQASQVRALVQRELASLRELLSLPVMVSLRFEGFREVAGSQLEGQNVARAATVVIARAPEIKQIRWLSQAAKANVKTGLFGFFSSASLTAEGDTALGPFQGEGGFNLGFAIIPTVRLSRMAVQALELRTQEIAQHESHLLESALSDANEAAFQNRMAAQAEESLIHASQAQLENYKISAGDVQELLLVRINRTQATLSRIRARTDLNLVRVNLHRMALSGPFAAIKDCVLDGKTIVRDLALEKLCR